MRRLYFDVKGMTIKRNENCDFSNIVANTKNYLEAVFEFDSEWNGFGKVAIFRRLDERFMAILENNRCVIPEQALNWDNFKVSIKGKKGETVLSTNEVNVEQVRYRE